MHKRQILSSHHYLLDCSYHSWLKCTSSIRLRIMNEKNALHIIASDNIECAKKKKTMNSIRAERKEWYYL
jgi:hypothetical protein